MQNGVQQFSLPHEQQFHQLSLDRSVVKQNAAAFIRSLLRWNLALLGFERLDVTSQINDWVASLDHCLCKPFLLANVAPMLLLLFPGIQQIAQLIAGLLQAMENPFGSLFDLLVLWNVLVVVVSLCLHCLLNFWALLYNGVGGTHDSAEHAGLSLLVLLKFIESLLAFSLH